MFQKKVSGYRKGGGIAYLAGGGSPEINSPGEKIRVRPPTARNPIPINRSPVVNPLDETRKRIKGLGNQFKGLNLTDKFKKGIGSVKDFGKKALPMGAKGLARAAGIGGVLYNVAPVPSFRLGESNPIRSLDIDPSSGSLFRGRGNNFIRGLDDLGKFDLRIEELEALGDKKNQRQLNELSNLKRLKNQKQQGGMFSGGIDKQLTSLIGGDRKAYDNTIDIAIDQLTSGSAATISGAQLGQINTAKGVADILNKNRDQLLELLQSGSNEEAQQLLSQIGGGGDQLKSLVKMLDVEAYEKLFPGEVEKEVAVVDLEQEAEDKAAADLRSEELDLAVNNQKAAKILAENRAIAGNTLDPKIEEKALMAAAYGGGPDATGFDYFKNADITRLAEEEKADKVALERAKVMGTGYNNKPTSRKLQSGLEFFVYSPLNPNSGISEQITDQEFNRVSGNIRRGLEKHNEITDYFDGLESLVENNNLTSGLSFVKEFGSRAINAISGSDTSTPLGQYQAISKAIQAYFATEILQESGRTISDGDRKRVEQLFANIDLSDIGKAPSVMREALSRAKNIIDQSEQTLLKEYEMMGMYNPQAYQRLNKQLTDESLSEEEQGEREALLKKYGIS